MNGWMSEWNTKLYSYTILLFPEKKIYTFSPLVEKMEKTDFSEWPFLES